jgi:high-affinity Fe2+/Pb2+ permease
MILRMGKQLRLRPMLIGGASVLLLMSAAFAGNALRSLQSADIVQATPVSWPRLPVFLAELTGIHPTREGLVVQAAMVAIFAIGAVWVFAVEPARRRGRVREAAEA